MITKFTKDLYQHLEEELALYADLGTIPVSKLKGAMNSIQDGMKSLKDYVQDKGFTSEKEEIDFFKYDKPKFVAEMVFLQQLTAVQIRLPVFGDDAMRTFYEAQLQQVENFFEQHRFFYEYYRLDADELDALLFLRHSSPLNVLLANARARWEILDKR